MLVIRNIQKCIDRANIPLVNIQGVAKKTSPNENCNFLYDYSQWLSAFLLQVNLSRSGRIWNTKNDYC